MSDIHSTSHSPQLLLASVLGMVETGDGDFGAIEHLAFASSDPESVDLTIERLSLHPQAKKAFASRTPLAPIDLAKLQQLPTNTLGYCYAAHMLDNHLKPLQSPPAATERQFLGTHITETHDLWHTVTGSKTDIYGEIQLEAFYVAQLEVSKFWLALLTKNLLKSLLYDLDAATSYMEAITNGWTMGKTARSLFGVDWDALWEKPIDEVRANLNIVGVAELKYEA
ncbi:Coq4 family protein [Chamaesiphon sp. OTE_20_metabat_361]|uniref:Coq4 family protein n=1 Tax=Chamaesiphon sp. OTE_20_metabat_361 TaxID=2964689 RepID=UPI00286A18BC|nr:Coq4 family protein [Chamaesiphon sp. OTE_20_metabat_361]